MCGIFGIASNRPTVERLLNGLSKLEYRGYDSSGISVLDGEIKCRKSAGKIELLRQKLNQNPIEGNIGISHTRWATHGGPNLINAHPHTTDEAAVVHNGIIENANELKALLNNQYNISCNTNTDTEVIPKLITVYSQQGMTTLEAINQILKLLKGSFTFAALLKNDNSIIAVRKGSPLLLGHSDNGDIIIASDPYAVSSFTEKIIYLNNYNIAHIKYNDYAIYNSNLEKISIPPMYLNNSEIQSDKGSFPNFMMKEIFEQPKAIEKTIEKHHKDNKTLIQIAQKIKDGITIVACGSSYFAALIAKYWLS